MMTVLVVGAVLALSAVGCSAGTDTGTTGAGDSSDPAKALVDSKCSMCHSLDRVYSAQKTAAEWEITIDRMKTNGMVITDEENAQILEYLSK